MERFGHDLRELSRFDAERGLWVGYDPDRGCFIDPSARFTGEACPDCGWPLIAFDVALPAFGGTPGATVAKTIAGLCPKRLFDPSSCPPGGGNGRAAVKRGDRLKEAGVPKRWLSCAPASNTGLQQRLADGHLLWLTGLDRYQRAASLLAWWLGGGERTGLWAAGSEIAGAGDQSRYRTAGLLVVDDAAPSGSRAGRVAEVLSARFGAMRPTVVASPCGFSEAYARNAGLEGVVNMMDAAGAVARVGA